jgi:hypothetical protein
MKWSSVSRLPACQAFFEVFSLPQVTVLGSCMAIATLAVSAAGCSMSGNYPVRGKVLDRQGQPIVGLEGAQIVFQLLNGLTSSVGEIQPDGSFEVFTERPGDGVPPGEYEVMIARKYIDPERPAPQVIDSKYEKFETSELRATVEKKLNVFEFKVDRVAARAAGS